MTTVGYGDISAYNTQARVHIHKSHCYFVLFIANIGDGNLYDSSAGGVMLYGYCLGAVASILTNFVISRFACMHACMLI